MFDLVIRNARCASSSDVFNADIGIRDGRIAALGAIGDKAPEIIDAAGRLVTPGGVDSHLHIDQRKGQGRINADDFYSGTVPPPAAARRRSCPSLRSIAAKGSPGRRPTITSARESRSWTIISTSSSPTPPIPISTAISLRPQPMACAR